MGAPLTTSPHPRRKKAKEKDVFMVSLWAARTTPLLHPMNRINSIAASVLVSGTPQTAKLRKIRWKRPHSSQFVILGCYCVNKRL